MSPRSRKIFPPVPLASRRAPPARALVMALDRLLAREPDERFAGPEDALRALAPHGAGELGSLRLASLVSFARARVT